MWRKVSKNVFCLSPPHFLLIPLFQAAGEQRKHFLWVFRAFPCLKPSTSIDTEMANCICISSSFDGKCKRRVPLFGVEKLFWMPPLTCHSFILISIPFLKGSFSLPFGSSELNPLRRESLKKQKVLRINKNTYYGRHQNILTLLTSASDMNDDTSPYRIGLVVIFIYRTFVFTWLF